MKEALKNTGNIPLIKIIAVKFWYVLGLFTVVYLGILAYALVFGLNPASEYSALIVIAISIGIAAIDLVVLWSERPSPAVVAMVLWVSPFYVLYKLFKHTELLNINSTYLPKRLKQYMTDLPLMKTVHLGETSI